MLNHDYLQIQFWNALDNKDRKYIDEFAQKLFDTVVEARYDYRDQCKELERYIYDVEYDLEEAEGKIVSLQNELEESQKDFENALKLCKKLEDEINDLCHDNASLKNENQYFNELLFQRKELP